MLLCNYVTYAKLIYTKNNDQIIAIPTICLNYEAIIYYKNID